MYKIFCITLFYGLVIGLGCSPNVYNEPIQVVDTVVFGHYKLSPPNGYWYFQRKFPQKFTTSKDFFLITFWNDKDSIPNKPGQISKDVFFNFAVSKNEYKDFDSYYTVAKKQHNLNYEQLPEKVKFLNNIDNWSCKYLSSDFFMLECITLKDNLIGIAAVGEDENKLLTEVSILKDMLKSFTVLKNRVL